MASNETGKKHPLAIAWEKWLASDEGQQCRVANTLAHNTNHYLENRLRRAFTAGANSSPSDAEQLIQLRKLAVEARDVLALLVPYGKIHTVEGVAYPDGTHSEAVDRGEHVLNQLRAALNPDLQKVEGKQ